MVSEMGKMGVYAGVLGEGLGGGMGAPETLYIYY